MLKLWLTIFALGVALLPASGRDQRRGLLAILVPGEDWVLVAEGFKFTEGPAIDGQGALYFTDIPNNKIHKIGSSGKLEIFKEDTGGANGLGFGPDGRLYACQNGKKRIVAYDPSGKEDVIAEEVESNDLAVASDGRIYFTDPANRRVWLIEPGGQKRVVDSGIARPNGIVFVPDQGSLAVADTASSFVWLFRVEPGGELSSKQPFYTLHVAKDGAQSGADGLTADTQGRLYVTTSLGLQVLDPEGRVIGVIKKPDAGWLANVVFGGPDRMTLYVTAAQRVFKRKVNAQGLTNSKQVAAKGS